MTRYEVQYTLPVDNPVSNVRLTKLKTCWVFHVPVNHPDAHTMGFMDLVAAADLSGLLGLPTHLNKTVVKNSQIESVKVDNKVLHPPAVPLTRKAQP